MLNTLTPTDACLDLIKRFESCKVTRYLDENGLPTIGRSHLLRPTITQEVADHMLPIAMEEVHRAYL
jgi:GH24 family phage-related lysozyme (muramidase)